VGTDVRKDLYPKAQLSSQRISDALADIGSEDAKRGFFKEYFRFLDKVVPNPTADAGADSNADELWEGILTDSSGLPNSSRMSLTAVNTHNGVTSEEIRLIYVVQQRTGLPLFYRYVAGNIVDVTTFMRTIAELKANGINTKFAILDAGYYTGTNADALLEAKVSFITRMKSNFKVYKNIVKEYLGTLQSKENLVRYHGRLVYIKHVECMIGSKEDRPAHAYICLDPAMRRELERKLAVRAEDEDMPTDEIFDEMRTQGVFMLISSRRIAKENLLPLYYSRDQVEKVFELCKQHGKILPINVEKEETLRGHLMMTFMAAILLKFMSDKLKGSALTTESMFMNLHEQHASVYDKEIITTEPTKKMNDAYKIFGVNCPTTIPGNLS
jgi:transposase